MNKTRLWRVDLTHRMLDYQAPSFWVETETHGNKTREEAEKEAIKLAKERTSLGRFPETWKIRVEHLENYFQLNGKWVPQGRYKLNEKGNWVKNQ